MKAAVLVLTPAITPGPVTSSIYTPGQEYVGIWFLLAVDY
jgi:hypothetical protein